MPIDRTRQESRWFQQFQAFDDTPQNGARSKPSYRSEKLRTLMTFKRQWLCFCCQMALASYKRERERVNSEKSISDASTKHGIYIFIYKYTRKTRKGETFFGVPERQQRTNCYRPDVERKNKFLQPSSLEANIFYRSKEVGKTVKSPLQQSKPWNPTKSHIVDKDGEINSFLGDDVNLKRQMALMISMATNIQRTRISKWTVG